MRKALLPLALLAFSTPAMAELSFSSIEDRAEAIHASMKDNNNYHARLAVQFADIALNEKGQHDLDTAKEFMRMAEKEAATAKEAK